MREFTKEEEDVYNVLSPKLTLEAIQKVKSIG